MSIVRAAAFLAFALAALAAKGWLLTHDLPLAVALIAVGLALELVSSWPPITAKG